MHCMAYKPIMFHNERSRGGIERGYIGVYYELSPAIIIIFAGPGYQTV